MKPIALARIERYRDFLRETLDIEEALEFTAQEILAIGGPMNLGVYCPKNFGGDYIMICNSNYDMPKGDFEDKMERLSDVIGQLATGPKEISYSGDGVLKGALGWQGEELFRVEQGGFLISGDMGGRDPGRMMLLVFRNWRGFSDSFKSEAGEYMSALGACFARCVRVHNRLRTEELDGDLFSVK